MDTAKCDFTAANTRDDSFAPLRSRNCSRHCASNLFNRDRDVDDVVVVAVVVPSFRLRPSCCYSRSTSDTELELSHQGNKVARSHLRDLRGDCACCSELPEEQALSDVSCVLMSGSEQSWETPAQSSFPHRHPCGVATTLQGYLGHPRLRVRWAIPV